jgi:histidine ammonia-lyase
MHTAPRPKAAKPRAVRRRCETLAVRAPMGGADSDVGAALCRAGSGILTEATPCRSGLPWRPVSTSAQVSGSASSARGPARNLGVIPLSVGEVASLARGERPVALDPDPALRRRLERAQRVVAEAQRRDPVYGVTTGVGASADNVIPESLRDALTHRLLRFHGCGTGRILSETEAAAVLVVRLATLARGHSGVRVELLERLCTLLNRRVLPQIPEEGSVGASGDLTPLSYLAALVCGEREASHGGRVLPAADALAACGLEPLALAPKESLAMMNGTSVMPALKPHPGQQRAAAWIREDLGAEGEASVRLQDRYSLRCAPHVIGVLVDALRGVRSTLEIEVNGVDDNPLIDPDAGEVLHGGNFYGGHVAFAMDGLKAAVASVADLLDRQLSLLCVPETSDGLPANLVASGSVVDHGFKAMQISASALTAEALKLTMPAASFSRSTESNNQDKVSMGTIAARDCRRVLDLTETVAAIVLLAGCQAIDLRGKECGSRRARALRDAVRKEVPMLREDRRQDLDIERVLTLYREGTLPAGTTHSLSAP